MPSWTTNKKREEKFDKIRFCRDSKCFWMLDSFRSCTPGQQRADCGCVHTSLMFSGNNFFCFVCRDGSTRWCFPAFCLAFSPSIEQLLLFVFSRNGGMQSDARAPFKLGFYLNFHPFDFLSSFPTCLTAVVPDVSSSQPGEDEGETKENM